MPTREMRKENTLDGLCYSLFLPSSLPIRFSAWTMLLPLSLSTVKKKKNLKTRRTCCVAHTGKKKKGAKKKKNKQAL